MDVWWLTFRQFAALGERHHLHLQRADLRAGVIAAVVANTARDPKKKSTPFHPADFFPGLEKDGGPRKLPKLTVEALKAEFIASGATVRSRTEEGNGGA